MGAGEFPVPLRSTARPSERMRIAIPGRVCGSRSGRRWSCRILEWPWRLDIGDAADIHPKDKADVGQRLALVARHVAYGQELVYSGPVYESMKVEGNKVRVNFAPHRRWPHHWDHSMASGVRQGAADG